MSRVGGYADRSTFPRTEVAPATRGGTSLRAKSQGAPENGQKTDSLLRHDVPESPPAQGDGVLVDAVRPLPDPPGPEVNPVPVSVASLVRDRADLVCVLAAKCLQGSRHSFEVSD